MVDALLLDLDDTLIDGAGLTAGTFAACETLSVEFGTDPGVLAAEANAVFCASGRSANGTGPSGASTMSNSPLRSGRGLTHDVPFGRDPVQNPPNGTNRGVDPGSGWDGRTVPSTHAGNIPRSGAPAIDHKPRSRTVTDGIEATTSRGMLRAVGMGDADWDKAQIGIASSWNEITPCNLSLDRLAQAAKEGVHAGGGYPLQFGTVSVSDGISMGHEGMHFSLVSREVIADSVEVVMQAERLDGSVLLAGCDKSHPRHADGGRAPRPGIRLPLRRLDRARLGAASATAPRKTSRSSTPSRRSARVQGRHDEPRGCQAHRVRVRPGRGCLRRHVHRQHDGVRRRGARAVTPRLRVARPRPTAAATTTRTARVRPSSTCSTRASRRAQILTKEAFENAIAVGMALGGSTNIVLHLLAIAHEAEVELTLDDFNRIGDKVPHIGDLKPFGKYVMNDVDRRGGVPVLMKALLDAGLLHGDVLTVTGKTMRREPRGVEPAAARRRSAARPRQPDPRDRRHHDPQGVDRSRGRRREDRRLRRRGLRGSGPGVRARTRGDGCPRPQARSSTAMSW